MKHKLLLLMLFSGMILSYAQVSSVAIVGEAAGGWPTGSPGEIDANQLETTDGENWTISGLTLTTSVSGGGIKFRANNAWDINWGADSFPTGIGALAGANIICYTGTYDVIFNSTTGAYSFTGGVPPAVVKLIGTAVDDPLGLVMSTNNGTLYTITNLDLFTGDAQFEIDGMFFGEDTFPSGVLTGLANSIPTIAANYASISLNIVTGEYNFAFLPIDPNANITISGSALGSSPTQLGMSSNDGVSYTYNNLSTMQGELLFHISTTETEIYGNSNFPTGIATLNGEAILVPSGTWTITFNAVTKSYSFTGTPENPAISIVGAAVGGWPTGTAGEIDANQLNTTDGITYAITNLVCEVGPVKFRQNNNWTLNWGSAAFPIGIGTQGSENIEVTTAGTYTVTFNRITGAYDFSPPTTIAIVGTGAGGWPTDAPGEIDANQLETDDGINFRLNGMTLTDGEVKFRQNNSWDVFWGGTSLTGTLLLNGPSIPTTAGTYSISMNSLTGEYSLSSSTFKKSFFTVYPNPTQNSWTVVSDLNTSILSIEIFDTLGKTVLNINPTASSSNVDATSVTKGLYFAKIKTALGTETIKLMKN